MRKALPGPPRRVQKCSSILYHFHIAFMGRHPACPGPEPGGPSHILRASRTLLMYHPLQHLQVDAVMTDLRRSITLMLGLQSAVNGLLDSTTGDSSANANPVRAESLVQIQCLTAS